MIDPSYEPLSVSPRNRGRLDSSCAKIGTSAALWWPLTGACWHLARRFATSSLCFALVGCSSPGSLTPPLVPLQRASDLNGRYSLSSSPFVCGNHRCGTGGLDAESELYLSSTARPDSQGSLEIQALGETTLRVRVVRRGESWTGSLEGKVDNGVFQVNRAWEFRGIIPLVWAYAAAQSHLGKTPSGNLRVMSVSDLLLIVSVIPCMHFGPGDKESEFERRP